VSKSKQTRIENDTCLADILQATKDSEPFWYYIIQRKGSNGIIDLVKFPTEQEAIEAARRALARFSKAASAAN
jgi:hypothetical protein